MQNNRVAVGCHPAAHFPVKSCFSSEVIWEEATCRLKEYWWVSNGKTLTHTHIHIHTHVNALFLRKTMHIGIQVSVNLLDQTVED